MCAREVVRKEIRGSSLGWGTMKLKWSIGIVTGASGVDGWVVCGWECESWLDGKYN
jgi:hypothetical protein